MKTEKLLDLMLEMDEGEESTGVLDYSTEPVTGRLTVTIDGRRVTLYLDPPDG